MRLWRWQDERCNHSPSWAAKFRQIHTLQCSYRAQAACRQLAWKGSREEGRQLFIAFIASAVGKEGAISVISALFTGGNLSAAFNDAMSGAGAASNLNEILLSNVSKAEALAFIFAMTFNMPCVVALAATFQETYSVKWTARIAIYYTLTALLLAAIACRIGLIIF